MNTEKQLPAATTPSSPARRDPADLAPSVDRDWANDFILELRMCDVPGDRIGDALVTVETHVRDSGEPVGEAFGEAIAYAREIAAGVPERRSAITARTAIAAVLGLAGMLVLPAALDAWLDGSAAPITVGLLSVAALTLLVLVAFLAAADRLMRLLMHRVWVLVLAMVLVMGGCVALLMLLPAVVASVPSLALGGAGVLLVAVSAVLTWIDLDEDDAVLAPGELPSRARSGRLATALVAPVFSLVILGFTWIMHLIA